MVKFRLLLHLWLELSVLVDSLWVGCLFMLSCFGKGASFNLKLLHFFSVSNNRFGCRPLPQRFVGGARIPSRRDQPDHEAKRIHLECVRCGASETLKRDLASCFRLFGNEELPTSRTDNRIRSLTLAKSDQALERSQGKSAN